MNIKSLLLLALFAGSLYAETSTNKTTTTKTEKSIFYGKILAIEKVTGYQYLNIDENGTNCWVAIAHAPVKVGDIIGYEKKTIMKNFKSKSLDKAFKEIIFASTIYRPEEEEKATLNDPKTAVTTPHIESNTTQKAIEKPSKVFVKKEFYTVEEAYLWREHLKGKIIKVKGTIRKISKHIMQLNWVHLVDGTGTFKEQNSDLIFTTKTLTFKEGDKVVATGKVVTDKDLGYGYFYKILLQESGFVGE